jgi:hypothetical protein
MCDHQRMVEHAFSIALASAGAFAARKKPGDAQP